MSNQSQIREQFIKSEAAIGITRQNFNKKFIYSSQGESDSFLLDRLTASPSQLQGFSIQQQKCIGFLMSQMIFKAGQSLKLPVSTTVVASSIAHYFFSRVGYLDHDFRDVVMGAMFLAAKSQETLRKSFQISAVFDFIFKVFEGQKAPIKVQVLNSPQYQYMRKKVIQMENHILFEQGFEVYKLFDIPHRYIGGLFKSFEKHPNGKAICQKAWTFLNDFYKTNCCLYYPGQIIAAAAVYMAFVKLNIKMPPVAWWVLMEANIQSIQQLIGELEYLYEAATTHKYALDWVATQINDIGNIHNFINVFPVNYYRKIMLDLNLQLKIFRPPIIQPPPVLEVEKKIQTPKNQEQSIKDYQQNRDRSRQRKKKKKEKSKKQKKDKKKKKQKHKKRDYSNDSSDSYEKIKSQVQVCNKIEKNQTESIAQQINKNEMVIEEPILDITIKEDKPNQEKKSDQASKQVSNAKDLLSMISNQLKKRQIKIQKQQTPRNEIISEDLIEGKPKIFANSSDQDEEDSDEKVLAQLIRIRKSNAKKQEQ